MLVDFACSPGVNYFFNSVSNRDRLSLLQDQVKLNIDKDYENDSPVLRKWPTLMLRLRKIQKFSIRPQNFVLHVCLYEQPFSLKNLLIVYG